ncbi:hypothetical protein HCN44_008764 [Aphidius gifuensis]|uniref:Conserved oligomeric Golgi complex subunit 7 n=1 Tax=Aphidius gifuensis TaxID=684658 RepID=A0A834XRY8_APHGI|nr:conserved oligomeric Golgi complex subunit 7 isoform X2 [Aphidius gifuensis]KAF7991452.1 hypothetical protein HCN44_008764 [Aphidius gifuensis]
MDISAFSDDDFDVKKWINMKFKSTEAQGDKDAYVSTLVMKLQLYVQQFNGSLEETSQSVLSSLPRILRDTQILQQEALSLKEKMVSVKQEIAKVDNDTSSSMMALEKIDKIKMSLQLAKQSLHEADNWSVLANDIEELFETDDIENIAVKICSMQKSLSMLSNAIDYEDKKMQLDGFKNRLEAVISPKIVHAFTAKNLDSSKLYVTIFDKMNRLPQLLKYYHNCLKVSLCQEWRKIIEIAQDENISYWLHAFYDKLLSEWHDQVKWSNNVFPDASIITILDIYTDLLQSLEPSIPDCISTALKQYSTSMQLTFLIELKQITRHFAVNLNGSIDMSFKKKVNNEKKLLQLAKAIYQPYVVYVKKYNTYETEYLTQQVDTIDDNHDDLSDTINSLSMSISKIIEYANDAYKRCKLFTDNCAYQKLIISIDILFKKYLDKYRSCIKKFNKIKTKHEDWNLFQMCLTLLQIIGDVLVKIEEFEKFLTTNIIDDINKLQKNNNENDVFLKYQELLLDNNDIKEVDDFLMNLKKNDKTLLEEIIKLIHSICGDLHSTTYEVIFSPIYTQLLTIKKAPAWSNDEHQQTYAIDLPDYSFSPQEYITQVGQYLMTLPQHLEPFLLRDNPSLMHALKAADSQYTRGSTESGFTDTLLGIIAKGTCQMFQDQTIGGIDKINNSGCKQLATDIDYLGNVFEELGLALSDNLQQMSMLLRLTSEEYQTGAAGCNPRIVAAVRQMRNIPSSG